MFWFHLFWFLGGLLFIQSLLSLRDGYKFVDYVRRIDPPPGRTFLPPTSLMIPCKGLEKGLEQNLAAYLSQDYPDYRVIFVVRHEDDPAFPVLRKLAEGEGVHGSFGPKSISVVTAGASETNGEKVHNLLMAYEFVDAGAEVLAFADSDARPDKGWLGALISPLADPKVTVSTGFRWYLPSASFASRLQAAWDASVATMLGDHKRNFAWGGSMALRVDDFRRMKVAECYWRGTVSDDYALTQAVRDARGLIRFEPRCLVATEADTRLAGVLRWTNRQIILTRVYAPRLWLLGMFSFGLYALGMIAGLAALVNPALNQSSRLGILALLATILALGMAKGRLRLRVAQAVFPGEKERLARHGGCYSKLTPLIPWVMLWNFTVAAFVRRIEWRGTVYHLKSRNKIFVHRRSGP